MQIMSVLWEDFDFEDYVTETQEGVSFGELRDRAGIEDSGNFNYHLGELAGTLVSDREDGYVLSPLGYNLMGALDRYTELEYSTIDEWALEDPCPFCGGTLSAKYRREMLEVRCRDCNGLADDGNFTFVELPSIGVQHLERRELLDAAIQTMVSKVRSTLWGLCWDCNSPIDQELDICDAHRRGPGGTCPTCNCRFQTEIGISCPTCGTAGRGPSLEYAIVSASVSGFFDAHGQGPEQIGPWGYRLQALGSATETVVETDPATVEVEFDLDGDIHRVRIEDDSEGISIETVDT